MAFPPRKAYEQFVYSLPIAHPEIPELASTFPHHYHEPPDIKHNRHPAPGISFQAPHVPTVIADCVALGEALSVRPDEPLERPGS